MNEKIKQARASADAAMARYQAAKAIGDTGGMDDAASDHIDAMAYLETLEADNDQMWRCTVCGRVGTVGRCCGLETREQVKAN